MSEEQNAQTPDASTVKTDQIDRTDKTPDAIPYSRFQEINARMKAAEDRAAKYEQAEKDREQNEALKNGEFQKVIESLKPKAERTEALENTLKSYLAAEIESIPESFRDLVPEGDVTTQLEWIKKAKAKGTFNRTPHPNSDAGATGDPKTVIKLTEYEQQMARMAGITDEEYAKFKR